MNKMDFFKPKMPSKENYLTKREAKFKEKDKKECLPETILKKKQSKRLPMIEVESNDPNRRQKRQASNSTKAQRRESFNVRQSEQRATVKTRSKKYNTDSNNQKEDKLYLEDFQLQTSDSESQLEELNEPPIFYDLTFNHLPHDKKIDTRELQFSRIKTIRILTDDHHCSESKNTEEPVAPEKSEESLALALKEETKELRHNDRVDKIGRKEGNEEIGLSQNTVRIEDRIEVKEQEVKTERQTSSKEVFKSLQECFDKLAEAILSNDNKNQTKVGRDSTKEKGAASIDNKSSNVSDSNQLEGPTVPTKIEAHANEERRECSIEEKGVKKEKQGNVAHKEVKGTEQVNKELPNTEPEPIKKKVSILWPIEEMMSVSNRPSEKESLLEYSRGKESISTQETQAEQEPECPDFRTLGEQLMHYYDEDVFRTLISRQSRFANLLTNRCAKILNPMIRTRMVDWLCELFNIMGSKLSDQVFFRCIGILDRYLVSVDETKSLDSNQVLLAGITSFVLACKYEEYLVFDLGLMTKYLSSEHIKPSEIVEMERTMLLMLDFGVGFTTLIDWLEFYLLKFLDELSRLEEFEARVPHLKKALKYSCTFLLRKLLYEECLVSQFTYQQLVIVSLYICIENLQEIGTQLSGITITKEEGQLLRATFQKVGSRGVDAQQNLELKHTYESMKSALGPSFSAKYDSIGLTQYCLFDPITNDVSTAVSK